MPNYEQLPPDAAEFLSLYDSLGTKEQADIRALLNKWADCKLHSKELATAISNHEEKQARRSARDCETSQRLKSALDRMPTAQAQLETIDLLTVKLTKSLTLPEQVAVCKLLRDAIRDVHFSVFDLNSLYQKYQETIVGGVLHE